MDIAGGVGVGNWVGVETTTGGGVGAIRVLEGTTMAEGGSVADLDTTLGIIADGSLVSVPTCQHPLREIVKANTNKNTPRIRDCSCLNILLRIER
jgi:hypothetical protein